MIFTEKIEKEWDYLGSLLQIASTKLYYYHSVIINVIEINRNQSLFYKNMAVCSQPNILHWQKPKNTKFTGLHILLYGKQVQYLHQVINF